MRKKERDKKSFFRRGQQHEAEDEFLIISNDELFEDVDDSNYDDEIEENEEFSENEVLENGRSEEDEGKDDSDNSESSVSEDADDLREEASGETEDKQSEEKPDDSEEVKNDDESKEQEEDTKAELEGELKEQEEDSESMTEEETDSEDEDLEEPENGEIEEVEIEEESEKSEPTEAEIALKKHRRRKKVLIAMLCVVFVFAAAYLGVSAFFYSHFYYNTKINGVDFSLKTVDEVQEYMAGEVAGYSLTLSELGGKKEVIYGSNISLKYVKDDLVKKQLEKQNPFLWFTAFWDHPDITASNGVQYN